MDVYEEFVLFLQQFFFGLCQLLYSILPIFPFAFLAAAFLAPQETKQFVQRLPYNLLAVSLFLLGRLFAGCRNRAGRVLLIDGWVIQQIRDLLAWMRTTKISPTNDTPVTAKVISEPNEPLPSSFLVTPETSTALPGFSLQTPSVPVIDSTLGSLPETLLDSTTPSEEPPCHIEPESDINDIKIELPVAPARPRPLKVTRPGRSQLWTPTSRPRGRRSSRSSRPSPRDDFPPVLLLDEEDEDNNDLEKGKASEPNNARSTAAEMATPKEEFVIPQPSENKTAASTTPDNSSSLPLDNTSRPSPSHRPTRLTLRDRKSQPFEGISVSQLITDKRLAECQDTLALHTQAILEQSQAMADLGQYIKKESNSSDDRLEARLLVIEEALKTLLDLQTAAAAVKIPPRPSSVSRETQTVVAKDQESEKAQLLIRRQASSIEDFKASLDKRSQECAALEQNLAKANDSKKMLADGLRKAADREQARIKQVDELQSALASSKSAQKPNRKLQAEIDQLKSKLASDKALHKPNLELRAEIDRLKEALAQSQSAQSSQVESSEGLEKLRGERDAAVKAVDASKKVSKELEIRINELQEAEKVCQKDLRSLRLEKENAGKETDALKQQVEQAKQQLESSKTDSFDKDQTIESLSQQLAESRHRTYPLEQEVESKAAQIASLEARSGQLQTELEGARAAHNQVLQEGRQVQAELERTSSELRSRAQELEAGTDRIRQLETWIAALQAQGRTLLTESERQTLMCKQMEEEHQNALAVLCKENDERFEELKKEHAEKVQEMKENHTRDVDAARKFANETVFQQYTVVIDAQKEEISNMKSLWNSALKTAVQEAVRRKDLEIKQLQEQLKTNAPATGPLGPVTPQKPIVAMTPSSSNSHKGMFSPRQQPPQIKELLMQKQCDQIHIATLKKEKAALEAQFREAEKEIAYLIEENDSLLKQDNAQAEISRLQEENDGLKTKTAELEDKLSDLMIDIDVIDAEKDELSEEHVKELDLKKTQLDQYGQKFTEATLKAKALQDENQALENAYNMEKLHAERKEQMQADLQQYQQERLAFYSDQANLNVMRKTKRVASETSEAIQNQDTLRKRAAIKDNDFIALCDVTESELTSYAMTAWSWTEAHHVSQLYFSLQDNDERNLERFEQFIAGLGASDLIKPRTQTPAEVEAAFQSLISTPKSLVDAPRAELAAPQSSATFDIQGSVTSPAFLGGPNPNNQHQSPTPRKILRPRTRG
ncbi:hypothetical protein PV10_07392 [Exophiala mesophila]|uniref:Uncharacterized protein n=1 Tax=Exophiala mesophila TaxID=212818 RepID=A0A0D1ZTF4_EXOME|nr:uncharacterized protein PV10_07392 [Exophiala mesophila]KIV90048.1 hypothetical protein PV10_07392 [Exophiala mesophila]